MKKVNLFWKRAASLVLSLALILSLTACGGSADNSASSADSESAGMEETSGKEPTVVRVGFNAAQVPSSYVDENGNLAGENYETLQLVDELLEDYVFEYDPVQQDVILTGLDAGTYDFGIGFIYTEDRAERYLFPEYPLSAIVLGLILPTRLKDNFTPGTSDEILEQFAAQGLTMIPVEPGSSADSLFTAYNETHDPKVNFEVAEQIDVATSIRYIASGRYDGTHFTTSNYAAAREEADPNGDTFFLSYEDGALASWLLFAQGQEELAAAVDGAMKQLFEDGTMAAISQKYYGENVFSYIDGFEYADVEPNPNYQ